jgi:hypothetical protein
MYVQHSENNPHLSANSPIFFPSLCPMVYQVPSHKEPIHQLDPPPPLTVLHYQDPSTP